jgi:hypothetical protein
VRPRIHPLLAAIVLTLPAWADEPAALAERLGAARYPEREAAARALEALGRDALPALRAARRSEDPEVRARSAALLARIEAEAMVRPTLVRLDFRDRPLAEVLDALAGHGGVRLRLLAPSGGPLAARPVTLQESEPVTFWEAIDQLGRAAWLRSELRSVAVGDAIGFGIAFEPAGERLAPTSCDGAFRVKLANLTSRRDLDLDPPGGATSASLSGRLLVSGEPRLILGQAGDLRLTEATLDTGRSLLADPEPPEAALPAADSIVEFSGGPELNLPLVFPVAHDPAARSIARLRGSVPVAVACPAPEPMVVPLSHAGQAVSGEDLGVTVEAIRPAEEGDRFVLALRFRAQPWSPRALTDLASVAAGSLLEQQLRVFDAHGRAGAVALVRAEPDGDELQLHVLAVLPEGGPPARLVLHAMIRAVVEVPFAFGDVPLP